MDDEPHDLAVPIKPPYMKPWTIIVRFGLEIAALTGIELAAWGHTTGGLRILTVVAATVLTAALWATFDLPNDPSRSDVSPVVVSPQAHARASDTRWGLVFL